MMERCTHYDPASTELRPPVSDLAPCQDGIVCLQSFMQDGELAPHGFDVLGTMGHGNGA